MKNYILKESDDIETKEDRDHHHLFGKRQEQNEDN